jgi:DnaK suppressor protein
MMKKILLNKIKELLETQRTELSEKTKVAKVLDIDADGDDIDAVQANIIALADAKIASRNKDKIIQIDNALKKIVDGKFGTCEECGEEIAEKRLLINPGFITCISCAEELEIMAKKLSR